MMAVQMLSEMDRRFLDDNMLTDEDFQFDISSGFELYSDETTLLKNLAEDFKLTSEVTSDTSEHYNGDQIQKLHLENHSSALNLSKDEIYNMEIKVEPPSPYSTDASSPDSIWSSELDGPVITIPDVEINGKEHFMLADTPPDTPPNIVDGVVGSPPHSESIFHHSPISVTSLSFPNGSQLLAQSPINMVIPAINIQPKPIINSAVLPKPGACKPVVLTPKQFANITTTSVEIKSPVKVGSQVPITSVNSGIFQPSKDPMKNLNHKLHTIAKNDRNALRNGFIKVTSTSVDPSAIKRQQRMIKNRESACLSRKKKKVYLQKLEAEVKEISKENSRLTVENMQLKQKVCKLEKENEELKRFYSSKSMKKTTCLMMVLFMLSFNFPPFRGLLFESRKSDSVAPTNNHVGRTLLWDIKENEKDLKDMTPKFLKSYGLEGSRISIRYREHQKGENASAMCPTSINKTESQRLENDLRGWVQRVEKKRKLKESNLKHNVVDPKPLVPPVLKLKSLIRRKSDDLKDVWAKRKNVREIQIYETPRKSYEDFFEAIHRRDDTFYFVSFSGDHLLLPATEHNKTVRPRMSLVMPALTFNDSMGNLEEYISMMQIDCEVMNTKLLYVKESVIPKHLRPKQNLTEPPISQQSVQYSVPHKMPDFPRSKLHERTSLPTEKDV